MVLGIETSGLLCSIAFVKNNQVLLEYNHEIPRQHAVLIGSLVEQGGDFLQNNNLIEQNFIDDLKLVAVAIGPGSFTGLRIGLSYAQGFCFGKNIPIIGINNHQILAESHPYGYDSVFTIIDARRDEVYLAKMSTMNNAYFEIEKHNVVNIKNFADEIIEESTLIYSKNTILNDSTIKILSKKRVNIIDFASYSATLVAKIGWQKYQQVGADNLSELEPLYIRPFAGV